MSDKKKKTPSWEKKENRLIRKYILKMSYRVRARDYRKVLFMMIVVGVLVGVVFLLSQMYMNFAMSSAQVSLVYPEIADGKYPDGSRFTTLELISTDRLQEALDKMQDQGKYTNFTVQDIAANISISSYLEESVSANVNSARSAGSNYTYVANEYTITFSQPHDFKSSNIFSKLFSRDYSSEFLDILVETNIENLSLHCGGLEGFSQMAAMGGLETLDYSDKIAVYKTKIAAIINFLTSMNANSSGYISENSLKSLKDVKNTYSVLYNERLGTLKSFVDTNHISNDLQVALNRLYVNRENYTLNYSKYNDYVDINKYAIDNYDHTFTENVIVVSTSDEHGLYQARPKTEYDLVVNQYNGYQNDAFECKDSIKRTREKIDGYLYLNRETDEYKRLARKCDALWEAFDKDYAELCGVAAQTVADYLSYTNENYLVYKVKHVSSVTPKVLVKVAIAGLIGMMAVFILYALRISSLNYRITKAKQELLESMQS